MNFKFILVLVFVGFLTFVTASDIPFGEEILNNLDQAGLNSTQLFSLGINYEDFGDSLVLRFLSKKSLSDWPEQFSIFENIMTELETGKNSYIKINKIERRIFEANFSVNSGDNYLFGNDRFCLPSGSRIVFQNGIIKILSSGGINFDCLPSLFNLDLPGNSFQIEGEKIRVSDDLFLEQGRIEIIPGGYLVKEGIIEYKKNKFEVDGSGDLTLAFEGIEDCQGNCFSQVGNKLEMKSSVDGYIDLEIQEGHEILNTDNKDRMTVLLKGGDALSFESRKSEGLIPLMKHYQGNEKSLTKILNDGIDTYFSETGWEIDLSKMPKEKEDFDGKYQSVAMEIESDIPIIANQKLRINSYRQFKTLDLDDNTLVTFNEYNLPISSRIEDNSLQTIAQMREKYPGIEFKVAESYYDFVGGMPVLVNNSFGEDNLPPYLLYLMEDFFDKTPNASNQIKNIKFLSETNAYHSLGGMGVGFGVVDPYSAPVIRGLKNPEKILEHEHEHLLDYLIREEEFSQIRNEVDLNEFFQSYDELKGERAFLLKEIELELEKENPDLNRVEELWKISNDLKGKTYEKEREIMREYYRINPDKPLLEQIYNQVAVDSFSEFYYSRSSREEMSKIFDQFKKEIDSDMTNLFGEKWVEREKSNSFSESIRNFLEGGVSFNEEEKVDILNKLSEAEFFEILSDSYFGDEVEISSFSALKNLLDLSPLPGGYKKEVEKIFCESSGMYDLYGLKDYEGEYDPPLEDYIGSSRYAELSSTLREQPESQIIKRLNSPSPAIKKNTEKLVQIAFDAGKMDVDQYKRLMGEGYCKDVNCCDKKCLIYTFLCDKC